MAAEGSTLIEGLEVGQVIPLDQAYDATLVQPEELFDGGTLFLLRGPASAESGAVGAFTFEDEFSEGKLVVLLAPFTSLPEDVGETLLLNMISFIGLES